MPDLLAFHAKICQASTAFLVDRGKILLVKHKKLGIWLAPGGHREPGELPHQTAERECREETGITVTVQSAIPMLATAYSQYLPLPFVVNVHWISEANYRARLTSSQPDKRVSNTLWPKGCEQHVVSCYLVKPKSVLTLVRDANESDAIGWFAPADISSLETTTDIKKEIALAFRLSSLG